jgi:hypothetical protein
VSIEIKIYGEDAGHALRELRDFAVGLQGRPAAIGIAEAQNFAAESASDELISSAETINTSVADEVLGTNITGANDNKPARVPGQPSPGKSRRTKAEIAEDDAAAKLANHERVASIKEDVLAGAAEQQAAYDSPEDAAQDAADEAAETAANKTGLTHDDLRQAAGRYQKKFGMAAAVAGVPALLGCAIVDVPEADLAAAIAKIDAAVAADAPGPVDDAPVEKPATKDDLVAAMKRYALKFDGQDVDMNAMPHTMADCPAIFKLLFGDGVEKLSQVPADGYAKTIAAIDEAIAKNPFKR